VGTEGGEQSADKASDGKADAKEPSGTEKTVAAEDTEVDKGRDVDRLVTFG
jgi:hypothetical protein